VSILIDQPAAGVTQLTLDNPSRRNALTYGMFESLAKLWPELESDSSVRAVVVAGAGAEAFCSGADLSANLQEREGIDDLVDRALLKTVFFSKPIVAAIAGHCVAGGLELALAADIRVASHDAKIGLPEVRWGILPSGGAAMKLIEQIGHANAMDLLLSGRLIDGRRAEQIGLVSTSVAREEVLPESLARAELIAANSPVAVAATKRAALARRYASYQEHEPTERALVAHVRASGHPRIGIEAFLAGRTPVFDAP
jgi:enoyl-CoA hydratase/carnithine racemase